MAIGLSAILQAYVGWIGVLAGDAIKLVVDLSLLMVAVELIHRKSYFTQTLNDEG